jgi:hypothetical protein
LPVYDSHKNTHTAFPDLQDLPGHVMTLKDRPIFTPLQELYNPAQANFEYHRSKTFRL